MTLGEPPGSYEICAVCFWEDDAIQLRWPDYSGGANGPCLIDAQRHYAEFAAMEPRFTDMVREATATESVEEGWRVVDATVDNFEPRDDDHSPWPDDRTTLYWWRPTYWRLR